MKSFSVLRSAPWVFVVAGFGRAITGCGSDFTCVDDRSCPTVAEPDGGGSGGSGGGFGSAGMDAGGTAGDAGVLGDGGPGADAGSDADAGPDTAPDAPSCETEQPNAELGVFVSKSGSDGADGGTCGAIGAPCATIKKALTLAKAGSIVYVDAGSYEEDGLALAAGVTLQGGWERRVGGAWTRVCTPERNGAAVIRAKSDDRTLRAVDLGGVATLDTLTIRSKLAAAALEQSLYGIFAVGATTEVTLRDVTIDVANAGAGRAGQAGFDGGYAARLCQPSTGANGAAVGASGTAAKAGSFSVTGYFPAPGIEGGAGGDGANGTAAPAPPCIACKQTGAVCQRSCSGPACYLCAWTSSYLECGNPGVPGCGGGGGGGGKPGTSGGSSVGVLVWDATVRLDSGSIHSGRGGDGGAGGPGGQGALGRLGAAGVSGGLSCDACSGSDVPGVSTCREESQAAGPGAPGGPGGSGKAGGPGGGGAGGHSYPIYKGGSAVLNVAAGVELVAGAPGSGGGAAPGRGADGSAAPIGQP